MEKFKICPACGEHEAPDMVFCTACSADLSRVPVTDEAQEAARGKREAEAARAAAAKKEEEKKEKRAEEIAKENGGDVPRGRPVRVCPSCKKKNRLTARICQGCGTFIGDVAPVWDIPAFRLVSHDGTYFIPVRGSEPLTLGRGAVGWAQMKNAKYVGREHARVYIKLHRLWIESLGSAKTYVGGKLISVPTALSAGDEIGLAVERPDAPYADGAVFLRVEAMEE